MDPDASSTPRAPAADARSSGIFGSRLAGLAVAVPCLAMLVTAVTLQPRAAGYGTARELGLPACSWITQKGYPCPTCGMTTSVALSVRGRIGAAWRAHPFGVVLTVGAAVLTVAGILQLVTGRQALRKLRFGRWWVFGAVLGVLAGWGWVLAIGVAAGKWPID